MDQEPIDPLDFILLHLLLGLPVYAAFFAAAIAVQRIGTKTGWLRCVFNSSGLFILSAVLALFFWAIWPFRFDIMQAEFVNIPATVACSMVFAGWCLVKSLVHRKKAKGNRLCS